MRNVSNDGSREPWQLLLDAVVFAPVGLVASVGEEWPKLVAKGHARVDAQLGAARVVGRFAIAQGRRQAGRLVGQALTGSLSGCRPFGAGAAGERAGGERAGGEGPGRAGPGGGDQEGGAAGETRSASAAGGTEGQAGAAGHPSESQHAGGGLKAGSPADGHPGPGSLAIPGYDSLSASQVVQRLAGLSVEELQAVRDYESATRGRRTILARISQLQAR